MLWIIRRILQLCIIGLIVLVILAVGVILFINPTNFKEQLSKMVQVHTGYAFDIKGPIEWSFRPQVALNFKDLTLAGPEGFKSPVIEAKNVHVIINPYSLFSSDMVINKLEAKDVIVTVERSESGKHNIESLKKMPDDSLATLTIVELSFSNVSILYQDPTNNRNWALNNASISGNNLQLNPTTKLDPVTIKGTVNNLNSNLAFDIETVVKTDLEKKTLTFDQTGLSIGAAKINGSTTISSLDKNPDLTGSFTLSPMDMGIVFNALAASASSEDSTASDTAGNTATTGKIQGAIDFAYTSQDNLLDIKDFTLQANDGSLKGSFKATLVSPYQSQFDVMINKIDLNPILGLIKSALPAGSIAQDITGNLGIVKTLTLNGKLAITDSKVNNIFTITQLTANISAKDSILNIMPITLSAMGGTHNMGLLLDMSSDIPKVKVNVQSDNLTIAEYLKLFNYPSSFVGAANAKISLEGTGNDSNTLRQTANGGININIKSGTLDGIYLDKLLNFSVTGFNDILNQAGVGADVTAVVKAKTADWIKNQQGGTPTTKFDLFDLKAQVKQGIAKSTVNMSSNTYDVKAEGTFNLADGKVDYTVKAIDKDLPSNTMPFIRDYVTQVPLTIAASGSLGQLAYTPDLQSFFQNGITQIQAQLSKRALSNMVDSTGASTLTSKSAEQIFVDALKDIGR